MTEEEGALNPTLGLRPGHGSQWASVALVAWALSRLLVLLALLYIAKDWILNFLGDPERLTLFVIGLASTPAARLLFFVAFGVLLTALCYMIMRRWPGNGYWIAVCASAFVTLAIFYFAETSLQRALPVVALLSANLLPDRLFQRMLPSEWRGRFMALAVGVAEFFFIHRFVAWVAELWTGRAIGAPPAIVVAAIAAFASSASAAILIHPSKFVAAEQGIRMTSAARIVARGNMNLIELDASGRYLFVSGHGLPRLLRYDVSDFGRAPDAAAVDTGNAQAFTQDQEANEIYVYDDKTRRLITLDATTLQLKNAYPVEGLASGDPWLVADGKHNAIVIVSEADIKNGIPFLTIDRSSGKVRDRRDLDAGNLLLVKDTSRIYMSFFRHRGRLMRYDLATHSIDKDVPAPPRADRMAHLPDKNEILLTVPVSSRIQRYDAETLAYKGEFPALFGVRTLAIDTKRRLLICGSLATGQIAIIDLDTLTIRSRHYLGPWLRTIVVDSAKGVAYISSRGFLYELKYDQLR